MKSWNLAVMAELENVIKDIREGKMPPHSFYLTATGAGMGADQIIWETPGASKLFAGSETPYDYSLTASILGYEPPSFTSEEVAIALANRRYLSVMEALAAAGDLQRPIISIGLSAAVATDRERRGSDRVHLALRTGTDRDQFLRVVSVTLPKDLGREMQGKICDCLIVNLLLLALGRKQVPLKVKGLESEELEQTGTGDFIVNPRIVLPEVNFSEGRSLLLDTFGNVASMGELNPEKHFIVPGSFDPFHFAHFALADLGRHRLQGKVPVFEISDCRLDKSSAGEAELARRATQMQGLAPVILSSNAPYFIDKVRVYGIKDFCIGTDTAKRILDIKYYQGSKRKRDQMLKKLIDLEVNFFVLTRPDEFGHLEEVYEYVPLGFLHMFHNLYRSYSISSTEIRS